jgi:lipoate-protein ligase A
MKLYNLGKVPWDESQLIYHALAALGTEALSLVSPSTAYVCIGFHQDAEQEVDLDYCRTHHIPVFRRDLGGGAVYLDGDQLFFQLILRKDNPEVPKRKTAFYEKFLQPAINVYRKIGISAEYKPINDLIAGTRKISGTGVAEMGDCIVFVGNLIVDFNYKMMSRVLNVPDEKFRDKVHKTLRDNLSNIRRELGEKQAVEWDEARLNALMAEEFQKLLGPMEPCERDQKLQDKMDDLRAEMLTDDWLLQKGKKRVSGRDIKVRAGTNVLNRVHKAPGGLIRADFEMKEGSFGEISISGDFFCFPEGAIEGLEARLEGTPIQEAQRLLTDFYAEGNIETPGIEVGDWVELLDVKSHS